MRGACAFWCVVSFAAASSVPVEYDSSTWGETCSGPRTVSALIGSLLGAGYDQKTRPTAAAWTHPGKAPADVVGVQVHLVQLEKVSTSSKFMEVRGEIALWWKDERLAFNGTESGGCFDYVSTHSYQTLAELWKPDVRFENAVNQALRADERQYGVGWYNNGQVLMRMSFVTSVDCNFYLARLPFDEHVCEIEIAPYVSWRGEVVLENDEGIPATYGGSNLDSVEFRVADVHSSMTRQIRLIPGPEPPGAKQRGTTGVVFCPIRAWNSPKIDPVVLGRREDRRVRRT